MIAAHAPDFHIAATMALIALAVVSYATERISIERTSILVLAALLLLFELAPLDPQPGLEKVDATLLLQGFANPALIAILCLLIVGEGLARTGALDWVVRFILRVTGDNGHAAIILTFATVLVSGAFLNNTPVVIMFIPILESVVRQHGISASRLMMPLSFVAIMAGMTTLIGSSTNLLVSGAMGQLTGRTLGFFEFTIPGLCLAAVGMTYLILVAPRLLRDRSSPMGEITEGPNRRYIAQLTVGESSKLVDQEASGDLLGIAGSRVILVQREEQAFVPPFNGLLVRPGDTLVILATLEALGQAQTTYPHLHFAVSAEDLPADEDEAKARRGADQMLAEVMIAPGSRFEGSTLREAGFHANFGCLVLGIERRAHIIRSGITDLRIRPGDILVLQGSRDDLDRVRGSRDFVVMDGSAQSLPAPHRAQLAGVIFAATVISAATGVLPIAVAAFAGVTVMVMSRVLTLRQAAKAVDRRIFLLVAASLALGEALTHTGGAGQIANGLIAAFADSGPTILLSALFLIVALMTNVLSNNATAVLFTPVAIGLAGGLGTDPLPFALAVLFGANCAFATPIGYQTNLLVMGPGYYTFGDFIRTGGPLVLVLWLAFTVLAPWYYGL